MVRSQRRNLEVLEVGAAFDHPGLALQRYLAERGDPERRATRELLARAAESPAPEAYRRALRRWLSAMEGRADTRLLTGSLASPLALGLGNESVLETGMTLHHTFGMPLIPGTALKGLCRRGAREAGLLPESPEHRVLFGDTSAASYCVFWDAWYWPDGRSPFLPDVVTVHHPQYYRTHGGEWPTDFDDPLPVPFLVVRPEARFYFALSGPSAHWLEYAGSLLEWSLVNLGAGAKTNASYGRFQSLRVVNTRELPKLKSRLVPEPTPQGQTTAPDPRQARTERPLEGPRVEEVTLATPAAYGEARVTLTSGETLKCTGIPLHLRLEAGQKARATVTWQRGRPVRAVWKP